MHKQGKNSGKCTKWFPLSPISSSAQLSCGFLAFPTWSGRLRTVFAPGSQQRELPRATFVPGSPFRGFLGRWERLWLWTVRGKGLSFQISDLFQKFEFSNSYTRCLGPLWEERLCLQRVARTCVASAISARPPSLFPKASLWTSQTSVNIRNLWITSNINGWQTIPILQRWGIYWFTDLKSLGRCGFRCGWIQVLKNVHQECDFIFGSGFTRHISLQLGNFSGKKTPLLNRWGKNPRKACHWSGSIHTAILRTHWEGGKGCCNQN